MKLLINDANILIDIVKLNLVKPFLSLKFDLHTTDFVFAELEESQQNLFILEKLTIIKTESIEDFQAISHLAETHSGLSFEDCSVWHYTRKLGGTLITGDGKLRKQVTHSGIEVKGIIYILDEIKIQKLLPLSESIERLQELTKLNLRLPHHEIEKRIQSWQSELNS